MGGAVAVSANYATWMSRVVAYLIDFALVAVGMGVLYFVAVVFFGAIGALGHGGETLATTGCCFWIALFPIATLLVGLYNRVYLVAQRGYSIGQGVMKLKVVDAQGNLMTQGTLVLRLLGQVVISIIPVVGILDVLWPLWDPTRQTLHDKAVGSFVINNPNPV